MGIQEKESQEKAKMGGRKNKVAGGKDGRWNRETTIQNFLQTSFKANQLLTGHGHVSISLSI